ncbi:MAG: hypothetical protein WC423_26805 [Vulcanimicrobiota bacterium]
MRWIILLCLLALPASAEPWISYVTSGGIAGDYWRLTIDKEGQVQYQTRLTPLRTGKLSKLEMRELQQAVPTPFPQPKPQRYTVADGYSTWIQVGQDEAKWSTGYQKPKELDPLLNLLRKIEDKFSD